MQVSSGSAASAQVSQAQALTSLLKTAQEMPAEMVTQLLAVDIQNSVEAQQMAIIGQIIDVYA